MRLKQFARSIRNFARVYPEVGMFTALRFLKTHSDAANEEKYFTFPLRDTGRNIFLRDASYIDRDVFRYVFCERYHRPPISLRPACTILDLGANIGLSVVEMKLRLPKSTIIGVEMDPANFSLAEKNIANLGNVTLLNKALWFENTTLRYNTNTDEDAYRIDTYVDGINVPFREIETITIDEILKSIAGNRIDFVKMDIEGAEKEVLTRNNEWLSNVGALNIEIHDGDFLAPALKELRHRGFIAEKDSRHWSAIIAYRSDYKSWAES